MLRLIKTHTAGLRYPVYASLTLAFALLGDAFLYPFLPQFGELMGIPVFWIGILLSINRFIRIVFNPFVTRLFNAYGIRQVTIIASIVAVISTAGYSINLGLFWLLISRVCWGMSYAVLRISTIAYAFEHEKIGISLGTVKSVQEIGPLLSLWIGPVLLNYFPGEIIFLWLALLSLPALFYAIKLPELYYKTSVNSKIKISLPSLFNAMTFLVSFIVDGMLVVMLGLFIFAKNPTLSKAMITSIVAGILIYRRICNIVLSPVSGIIADKIGLRKVYLLSMILIAAGFTLMLSNLDIAGLLLVFTFHSVNSTVSPGEVANVESDKIKAVSNNVTWRDIGAAAGTLFGSLFLSNSLPMKIFIISSFILLGMAIIYYKKQKN